MAVTEFRGRNGLVEAIHGAGLGAFQSPGWIVAAAQAAAGLRAGWRVASLDDAELLRAGRPEACLAWVAGGPNPPIVEFAVALRCTDAFTPEDGARLSRGKGARCALRIVAALRAAMDLPRRRRAEHGPTSALLHTGLLGNAEGPESQVLG